jgi:predicted Zn finger-like uncharacterized protein
MIHVQCPRCQTRFTTSDANLGKTGQCPKCGNPIKVQPSAAPSSPSGGGEDGGGAASGDATSETDAAQEAAMADSALGAARRHAAQASSAGEAGAEAPAAPPEMARPGPAEPPAEADEAAAAEPPPAERAAPESPAAETAAETAALPEGKSKTVALVLCIFLGWTGAHRFYMGSWGWGLVILGLDLTCLGGAIFILIDIIKLATMDKADFQDRYNEQVVEPFTF